MIARLVVLALLVPTLAEAAPALVTTTRGGVEVVAAGTPHPAPAAPFVLQEGETLKVADGGLVVLLYEGHATQVSGPATLDHAGLKRPATTTQAGVDVLDELLTRHVSTAPTGASRGGGSATLVRPVPGSALATAHDLAWRCDGCGEQQVAVHDLLTGDVVWTGKGTEAVTYGGPALGAGAYAVVLQGRDYAFTVIDEAERTKVKSVVEVARSAAAGLDGEDPAMHASIEAAVWFQAGLPSDGLWVVDQALKAHPADPGLVELRATLERRAGLAP